MSFSSSIILNLKINRLWRECKTNSKLFNSIKNILKNRINKKKGRFSLHFMLLLSKQIRINSQNQINLWNISRHIATLIYNRKSKDSPSKNNPNSATLEMLPSAINLAYCKRVRLKSNQSHRNNNRLKQESSTRTIEKSFIKNQFMK